MSLALRLVLICLAWVVVQIAPGFVTHHLPRRLFERDSGLYRTRRWEAGGAIYQRLFRVRKWKDRLPEAGAMFAGGVSKRSLAGGSGEALAVAVAETRRAELTHWLAAGLSFSFFLWNPPQIAAWMPLVGILGNAPFIIVQRHLRPRMIALQRRGK